MKLLKNLKTAIIAVVVAAALAAPIASAVTVENCTELGWRGLFIAWSSCVVSITCEEEPSMPHEYGVGGALSGTPGVECEVCVNRCWTLGLIKTITICDEVCKKKLMRFMGGWG